MISLLTLFHFLDELCMVSSDTSSVLPILELGSRIYISIFVAGVFKGSCIGMDSSILLSETMNMSIFFCRLGTLFEFSSGEGFTLFVPATGIFKALLQITCLNKLIQPSSMTILLFFSVFIKVTYGKKTKYKIMLWINVPCPRNLAREISVADMAKLPTISNIDVAAVICALITIVLIFSLLLELDTFAGAISLEAG